MKYLFILVLIIALPNLCFARKYQAEPTQFDLHSQTSCIPGISVYTHKSRSSLSPIMGVSIKLEDGYNNFISEATTDADGFGKICDLDYYEYYELIAKKRGYDIFKYRFRLPESVTSYESLFQISLTLYKKGKSPTNNSYIELDPELLISYDDFEKIKIKVTGSKTGYSKTKIMKYPDGNHIKFDNLKADDYTILITSNNEKYNLKIGLKENSGIYLRPQFGTYSW